MSPEERSLLERTHEIAEENNKILKLIRRNARIGTAMRILYWVVILGLSFGAYYFIQPYLQTVSGLYGNVSESVDNVHNVTNQLTDLLK